MITRNYYEELKDINRLLSVGKLLDLGSGNGRFSLPFNENKWNTLLIDINESRLDEAKNSFKKIAQLEIVHNNIFSFITNDKNTYKIIIAHNILPFFGRDYSKILDYIFTHLDKEGIFIGSFFGVRDPWVNDSPDMFFHKREKVIDDLNDYILLDLREIDAELGMIDGTIKPWHRFEFIAKKSM